MSRSLVVHHEAHHSELALSKFSSRHPSFQSRGRLARIGSQSPKQPLVVSSRNAQETNNVLHGRNGEIKAIRRWTKFERTHAQQMSVMQRSRDK